MQLPITIGLYRSRFLDGFVILSSLLACGAIWVFPRSTLIQATIFGIVFLFTVLAWHHLTPRISAIRLEQSGKISLLKKIDESFIDAEFLLGATVHPWLTVVRLKTDGEPPLALIITVDSLTALDFRRLRVFLRWRAEFIGLNDAA